MIVSRVSRENSCRSWLSENDSKVRWQRYVSNPSTGRAHEDKDVLKILSLSASFLQSHAARRKLLTHLVALVFTSATITPSVCFGFHNSNGDCHELGFDH